MRSFLKRVLGTVPVLIGVVLLIFVMLRIIPGDPAAMLLGEHVDQATIDRLTEVMGLNESLPSQFFKYVTNALHGDLGVSYNYNRNVTDMILEALPYTVVLAVLASLFAWILGLVTGILAAIRQNSLVDRLFMGVSLMGVSMPIFMVALFLQYLLGFKIKLFPLTQNGSIYSMILPAVALGWNSAGRIARMTRSSLLEVMQADYIDTARAKGLRQKSVIVGHALKNSMLQMVFQDPYASLNPRMKVRNIIAEPLDTYHVCKDKEETTRRVLELMRSVGVPAEFLDRYPHQFSGGQRQRIGIARAIALQPELIVCDEPVSALDVSVQSQVLNLLKDLQEQYGLTYLFIGHDLSVINFIADRVCVMFLGSICEIAAREELYTQPLHPYTSFLLDAIPQADPHRRNSHRQMLSGEVPSPVNLPGGCYFHTRCPYAQECCRTRKPELRTIGGRTVACHRAGELRLS